MERYFKHGDEVSISLQRVTDDMLELSIRSDYRFSYRKSKIGFSKENIKEISDMFKRCWKETKTKKLLRAQFYFEELDWYDNMTDVYTTPIFSMKRGSRVPKVTHQSHGSIPKEWGAVLCFTIEKTTKITPLMEIVDSFFKTNFNKEEKKILEKMFREVLSGRQGFGLFMTP